MFSSPFLRSAPRLWPFRGTHLALCSNSLASQCVRQRAARAFAMRKLLERRFEVRHHKVRPGLRHEHKFREGAFPSRKSDSLCSPPVRISRSTSVEPPRYTSASTRLKDSGESSVTL